MKKINKIFIVIPAFNEQDSIAKVVSGVAKYANKIVVIDDGSTDNTSKVIKNKKTVILKHLVNLGQGAALQTGFEYAKFKNADIVVTFDADGQFSSTDVPRLIKILQKKNLDVVLGSRFLRKTKNIPFAKLITLKLGIVFTNIFSGLSLTDTHNGFRVLNKVALERMSIKHNRMAHASEIIDEIRKHKLKYQEAFVKVSYNTYSIKKGQPISNSLNIIVDLIFNRLN